MGKRLFFIRPVAKVEQETRQGLGISGFLGLESGGQIDKSRDDGKLNEVGGSRVAEAVAEDAKGFHAGENMFAFDAETA